MGHPSKETGIVHLGCTEPASRKETEEGEVGIFVFIPCSAPRGLHQLKFLVQQPHFLAVTGDKVGPVVQQTPFQGDRHETEQPLWRRSLAARKD